MRQTLLTAFWLARRCWRSASWRASSISLMQIVTSIQDTAFSTIPRLVAFLAGFLLLLPWMLQKMMAYTIAMLGDLGRYAR